MSDFNQQENNHIPKKLLLVLLLLLIAKFTLSAIVPKDKPLQASDLTTDSILTAVNRERSLRNLVLLNTNSKLTSAAQSKADDMQARHYFAHVDPDGHYIWDKIVAAGYSPYSQLGENLAIEFYDTESLMAAWMNSPTHRANVLQEGFRDQGMGLTFGDTSLNQYHSAVANTFGTLAVTNKPSRTETPPAQTTTPPKTTTKPPVQTTPPAQTKPEPPITTTATPSTSPVQTLDKEPIKIRGEEQLAQNNPDSNFAVPGKQEKPAATSSQNSATNKPAGPVGSLESYDYKTNRYLILVCGVVLLMLMLSNIKDAVEKKLGHLDKKINNLVLLLISIFVIGFLYWL
ncbi:MAG: CAP domain-containing protein [Candidatus Doudnabacteria bacterium]|nr:CAP domain-containing protein [Candidatus Doudnabacteria bacterium]